MKKTLILSVLILLIFTQNIFSQAYAGPDQEICVDQTFMQATDPAPNSGLWTFISGSGTFADSTLYNTLVTDILPGMNIYTWQVDSEYDEVTITNNEVRAEAGPDQIICTGSTTLNAVSPSAMYPFQGTGHWTSLSGNSAVIINSLAENSAVSNLPVGTTAFRWTVDLGSCTANDIVQITNASVNVYATDIQTCEDNVTLTGNQPAPGESGIWSCFTAGVTFDNQTLYNTKAYNLVAGINTFVWTLENEYCSNDAVITVTNNNFNISAGPDQTLCTNNTVMNADDPLSGTGYWTLLSGSGIFSNSTDRNAIVTGIGQGTNVYTWTVTRNGCTNSCNVAVTNNSPSTALIIGPFNTETCNGTVTLSANYPAPYYADNQYWELISGSATFNNPITSFIMNVSDLAPGNNIFKWAIERGTCPDSEDFITITNNEVTSVAGQDQIICTDNTFLNATDPAIIYPFQGTGHWTTLYGGIIIDNSLLETTLVSNIPNGSHTFFWTVDLGSCSASDNVCVTSVIPTQADAGPDTTICNSSLPNLYANNNYNHEEETAFWRVIQGGATITDPTLYNSSVTNLDYNCSEWTPDWWTTVDAPNIFEWVIRRGSCESTDQVRVLNGFPDTINAGVDQTVCENVVNLDALDEASCTQEHWWEQIPDVGDFYDPVTGAIISDTDLNMPFNVHVDPVQNGMTQFVWHKRNNFTDSGGNPIECHLTDTVEITSLGLIGDVQAGTNDAVCQNFYILDATPPEGVYTPPPFYTTSGQWSVISGNGNFDDDTYYNTTVRNMAASDNIYRWTVINHTVNCITSDDVYIHNAFPSDATAGPDDVTCNDFAVLSSNLPERYTDAFWTVEVGGATIIENSCIGFFCSALATNLADSLNIFVWHVINEYTGPYGGYTAGNPLVCESIDSTEIIYRAVTADAGMDIYECGDFTQLNANQPYNQTGLWTGPGIFESSGTNTSTLFNDIVYGLTPGKNTFTWTVSNESCSDSDEMVVWGLLPPAPFANVDQTICSSDVNLNANDVSNYWSVVNPLPPFDILQEAAATGYWSANVLGVTFDNASDFNTTAHNIPANGAIPTMFIWHSLNNFTDHATGITRQCVLTDTMFVYNNSVTSVAGPDGQECGIQEVGASYTLMATPVTSPHTGVWSAVFAPGATIVNPTLHNTQVTGMLNGDHIYRWTVSSTLNGLTCSAADFVTIEVRIPTTVVVAPPSTYEICEDFTTLQANIPNFSIGETGLWTEIPVPSGIIVDPTSNVSLVTGIGLGTRQFQWTIDNDGCTSSDIVTVNNNMVTAFVGDDFITCGNDANLVANELFPEESGLWTKTTACGSSTILSPSTNETVVTGLCAGVNRFRWTVYGNGCSAWDEITVYENSFYTTAGFDQHICDTMVSLHASDATPGNGFWSTPHPDVTIVDPTSNTTMVYGLYENTEYLFRWTVYQNGCSAWDEVIIYNDMVQAHAGGDQIVCTSETTLSAENPIAGNGFWVISSGAGSVTDPTYYASTVIDLGLGTNTLTWTVINLTCFDADEVVITRYIGTEAYATDQINCDGTSILDGNVPGSGENGLWSIVSGSGTLSNPTLYNSFITDMDIESVSVLNWVISNVNCSDTAVITVTNNGFEIDAGPNNITNSSSYQLNAEDPNPGTGLWTVLSGYGIFNDNTLFNTTVTGYSEGDNTYRWTVIRNACTDDDDVTITYDPVNINELINFGINIYPNPTDGLITVSSSIDLSDAILELTNISGQEVQYRLIEKSTKAYTIDMSNLAKGMYFLKIRIKGQTKMLRLVKK